MTRKGRLPIPVPKDVEIKVEKKEIFIKGPKGQLKQELPQGVVVTQEEGVLKVAIADNDQEKRNLHGLYRTLIDNMVAGTTKGFEKRLEMIGVGYRATVQGKSINLQVGLSHPTLIPIPEGLHVVVEKNTMIVISGVDKQQIGQFAAAIRSIRPPEPYQGKGIRYQGEYVRRKAGKTASKK